MKKLKVLNLYAGIGGNRKHWENVDVTAIELEENIAEVYSKLFPGDTVLITDAHQYLKDNYKNYDFIWSSTPCPTHSRLMMATRHKIQDYPDMKLYQEIIFLKHFFHGKYVVENVKPYYQPLIHPSFISSRHYFWTNFKISPFELKSPPNFIGSNTIDAAEKLKKWLGIDFEGQLYYRKNHSPGQVLRNCVHPDLGLHIFNHAAGTFKNNSIQSSLF